MTRVSRSLYRSLLKIAKHFDDAPASKALLYRKSLSNLDKGATSIYYTELLDKLFEKDSYLFQPWGEVTSLRELVRSQSRGEDLKLSKSDRLDAGFAVLRKLSSLWNSFISLESDEFDECLSEEDENAKLSSKVTLSNTLSSGVLLLAHPMLQGPLHRSVILLLEHNSKGSYGIVINRGTDRSLESSVKNLPENILDTFGQNNIAFGGMVRRLTYLHDVQQVGGVPIPTCKTPMYAGGPTEKAISFVEDNNSAGTSVMADVNCVENSSSNSRKSSSIQYGDPAERFRFFVGCCLWEADELEKEVSSGYWIPTHSEPDQVLALSMPNSDQCHNVFNDNIDSAGNDDVIETTNRSLENDSLNVVDSTSREGVEIEKVGNEVEIKMDGETQKLTIKEILDSVEALDDGELDEEFDREENFGVDVWKVLLRSLGEPFSALAELPKRFSAKNIESADWK